MAILTISRQLGSGGREVGQGVASSLGYDYIDKQRFLEGLRAIDETWEQWGKDLDEKEPSFIDKFDWSYTAYGALVQGLVLDYALRDNVVVMERGGNFLLKGVPHAYRIRVIAPMDARIKRLAIRESIDFDSARWLSKRTDRERAGFVYSLFGKPWDDPAEFDDVFDTEEKPIEELIIQVIQTLTARDRKRSPEADKALKIRAVAAQVKARLVMNPKLFVPTLEVECDGKEIHVSGIVRGPRQAKRVEEEAIKFAAGSPVKFELRLRG